MKKQFKHYLVDRKTHIKKEITKYKRLCRTAFKLDVRVPFYEKIMANHYWVIQ